MHWMRTHTGKVRSQNEDATLVAPPSLFAVADGMGGHNAGEVASHLAAHTVEKALAEQSVSESALCEAFQFANAAVYQHAANHLECKGMGTTLSVMWMGTDRGLIGHVGDSRVYRWRTGNFQRLTQDHSMVEEWVRQGLLTAEEALHHPYRNVITRALGIADRVEVDVLSVDLLPDDLYLICSDGLSNMVGDTALRETLAEEAPMEQAADQLMEMALQAGGKDNITFIILRHEAGVGA